MQQCAIASHHTFRPRDRDLWSRSSRMRTTNSTERPDPYSGRIGGCHTCRRARLSSREVDRRSSYSDSRISTNRTNARKSRRADPKNNPSDRPSAWDGGKHCSVRTAVAPSAWGFQLPRSSRTRCKSVSWDAGGIPCDQALDRQKPAAGSRIGFALYPEGTRRHRNQEKAEARGCHFRGT